MYSGPQMHTEFEKPTPNSKSPHRIRKAHTEFEKPTPNSKSPHQIWKAHTEFENLTPNSKTHTEFQNLTPNSIRKACTKCQAKLISSPLFSAPTPMWCRPRKSWPLFGNKMADVLTCGNCNYNISIEDNYCSNCGKKLTLKKLQSNITLQGDIITMLFWKCCENFTVFICRWELWRAG